MKILIWVGCILVAALIRTGIAWAGASLGVIETVVIEIVAICIARALCKKLDTKKEESSASQSSVNMAIPPKPEGGYACSSCSAKQSMYNNGICLSCGSPLDIPSHPKAPVKSVPQAPVREGNVTCSKCGKVQSAARSSCYSCGNSLI